MIIFVVFFAAVAVLRCAADDSVTTSLLLPAGLFLDASNQKPTFVGQVTVTRRSTTCYTIDCSAGGAASYFYPGNTGCSDNSYTFTEISASTQYLIEDELLASAAATSAAATSAAATSAAATTSTDATIFITMTINCDPVGTSGSATCTTTYTDDPEDYSAIDPSSTINVESSLYAVFFTEAASYSAASSTVATTAAPSPTSRAPTARSATASSHEPSSAATTHSSLGASLKVGIGLGVPLGACAIAGLALLLYRHGKHKERSRMNQNGNLAPPSAIASEPKGKHFSDAGVGVQTLGRSPPVYSMEMQG